MLNDKDSLGWQLFITKAEQVYRSSSTPQEKVRKITAIAKASLNAQAELNGFQAGVAPDAPGELAGADAEVLESIGFGRSRAAANVTAWDNPAVAASRLSTPSLRSF